MDHALNSLSSEFQPFVFQVLARLVERRILVMIIQTSRTPEEAAANLTNGTSATSHSKHLPRQLRGIMAGMADDQKSDAIDLCPYDVYYLSGPNKLYWSDLDKGHAAFAAIGEEGEKLGLRWGGRWKQPHDPGHLELLFPGERYPDIPVTSAAAALHRS